jgi:hypothetical protein
MAEKSNDRSYFIVGTRTGKCPLCKETKKLILLKFNSSLCEDCFCVCMEILEHLLDEETSSHASAKKIISQNSKKVQEIQVKKILKGPISHGC